MALTKFPCLLNCSCHRCRIAHDMQTEKKKHFMTLLFQWLDSFEWPWDLLERNKVCLCDCLPSIMNNLLTIRGCCRALFCCHAPQPETHTHYTLACNSRRVERCFASHVGWFLPSRPLAQLTLLLLLTNLGNRNTHIRPKSHLALHGFHFVPIHY